MSQDWFIVGRGCDITFFEGVIWVDIVMSCGGSSGKVSQ